ncbi:MAG: hypothetical protein HXY40_00755 [Chloroflexi bacterium]|nr:hypothetical protein [Chloroflexota bacterium]
MDQLRPLLTLLVLNLFEFFGLVLWLRLADDNNHLIGAAILVAGLFLERFTVYVGMVRPVTQDQRAGLYARRFIIQAARETLIWVVWLWIAVTLSDLNYVAALAFLFVAMLLEHSADVAEHNGKVWHFYLTNPTMLFLTAVEAVGATAWLYLLDRQQDAAAVIVLFVAFVVEHIFQGRMVEIKPPAAQTA